MSATGGNLDGYRVLDLTAEPGFLAGKLLGDLGADVIKIESRSGDAARQRGPFVGGISDPERSVLWLALNTSKRGVTLNLDDPRGHEIFLSLCRSADAVIAISPAAQDDNKIFELYRRTGAEQVPAKAAPNPASEAATL